MYRMYILTWDPIFFRTRNITVRAVPEPSGDFIDALVIRRNPSHPKGFAMKDSTDQVPQFMKYFFVAFIVCASASMLIVYWLGHA